MSETEVETAALEEGELKGNELEAYFGDLAECADVTSIRVRGGHSRFSDGAAPDLKAAHEAITRGEVRAVQIRYRFEGQEWCDSLMVQEDSTRLVRSKTPRHLG